MRCRQHGARTARFAAAGQGEMRNDAGAGIVGQFLDEDVARAVPHEQEGIGVKSLAVVGKDFEIGEVQRAGNGRSAIGAAEGDVPARRIAGDPVANVGGLAQGASRRERAGRLQHRRACEFQARRFVWHRRMFASSDAGDDRNEAFNQPRRRLIERCCQSRRHFQRRQADIPMAHAVGIQDRELRRTAVEQRMEQGVVLGLAIVADAQNPPVDAFDAACDRQIDRKIGQGCARAGGRFRIADKSFGTEPR